MTLRSQIQSDVDTVFLSTSDFAEQVIRFVGSDTGDTEVLTAVVTLDEPELSDIHGKGYMQKGMVMVADSVTVTTQDAMQIRGKRFEVRGVNIADFGAVHIDVTRYIGETRGVKTTESL